MYGSVLASGLHELVIITEEKSVVMGTEGCS